MNEKLQIRRMKEEDVECVSVIEQACFTMPWSANAYRQTLKDHKSLYLVALIGETIVGMCGLINILGEANIQNVAVQEAYREKGIAFSMLNELIRMGEAIGVQAFTLEVRTGNAAAIHVYEKLGFVSEGIRPRFYEKPVEDALIMWRRKP